MEYKVYTNGARPDIDGIKRMIVEADPAALVDTDRWGQVLRVSTVLDDGELLTLVNQAGCAAKPQQIERVPSVCCGGCGG